MPKIEQLRKNILEEIDNLANKKNEAELESITGFIFRHRLEQMIDELVRKKFPVARSEIQNQLKSIFLRSPGKLGDKITIVKMALDEGWFDDAWVVQNKASTVTNITSIIKPTVPSIFTGMIHDLVNIKYGAGVGKGETFLTLGHFTGRSPDKGDLEIDKKYFEIKGTGKRTGGSGARFKGQGKFWQSIVGKYESVLIPELKKLLNVEGVEKQYPPDSFKLNKAGIEHHYNMLFEEYNVSKRDAIVFMKQIVRSVFFTASESELAWIRGTVNEVNTWAEINFEKWRLEFILFQLEYYQTREKFEAVIFVNTATDKLMVVKNSKELRSKISYFNVVADWDWKYAQSNTYRIGLRG